MIGMLWRYRGHVHTITTDNGAEVCAHTQVVDKLTASKCLWILGGVSTAAYQKRSLRQLISWVHWEDSPYRQSKAIEDGGVKFG